MSSPVGDAFAVDQLASTYENAAHQLVDSARRVERQLEHAVWQGPKADRFRQAASQRRWRCEQQAAEMQDIARALRRHAQWIRDRERSLVSLEQRIIAWATANPPPPDGIPRGPDASLIRHWPGRMSPDWEDLARQLRAMGATF
jgi:hypothetical protein